MKKIHAEIIICTLNFNMKTSRTTLHAQNICEKLSESCFKNVEYKSMRFTYLN